MKLIDPKFEDLTAQYTDPVLLGERCTRVCYKSEDKIAEGSATALLTGIAKSGHGAMLEHITVYLKLNYEAYSNSKSSVSETSETLEPFASIATILASPYSKFGHSDDNKIWYISTNLRVIYENSIDMFNEYLEHHGDRFTYAVCPYVDNCRFEDNDNFKRRVTILFDMDRIGSQSFCRHRTFGFAQESTRWCNYIKDKFGSEISISTPCWLKPEDHDEFVHDMELYEQLYFKWINKGYKAQEARYFLPFGTHTQIIMTGFVDAWEHFFELRVDSHAHIQAQELAVPLQKYFIEKGYV